MASNTRATHKISEEETRGRRSSARLASASVPASGDSSGLRRSTRETSSNKTATPEKPTTRKSERLGKQNPPSPPVARRSAKKGLVESPLRRSERCKKHCPSLSSSGSRNAGMEKSDKRAKEVDSDDTESSQTKKEWMDAHAYKSLFRKQDRKAKLPGNVDSSGLKFDVNGRSRSVVLALGNVKACPIHYEEISSLRKFPARDCTNSESHSSREFDASETYRGDSSRISEKLSFVEQLDNPVNESNLNQSINNNVQPLPSPGQRVPSASDDIRRRDKSSSVEVLPRMMESMTNGRPSGGDGCKDMGAEVVADAPEIADRKDNTPAPSANDDIRRRDESSSAEVLPRMVESMTNGRPSGGDGCKDMGAEVVVDASQIADCKDNTPAPSRSNSTENFSVEERPLNLKRKSGELEGGLNSTVGESFSEKEQQSDQSLQVQANGEDNECSICKLDGSLLCCDGKDCKRSFHLSCLNPPLKDIPPGVWYCSACVGKKMAFGACSVSQGVEAIFDVRQVEASDANGSQVQKLKDRVSRFVVPGGKIESSRFLEYWVPVQLSNVQLEQYCATLLSNSLPLRSTSKTDPVGALRDILCASRKCCDHPYLVDPSLQKLLFKDIGADQYLDVGIKACGKLQLLDKLLLELQNRGLRALIMFQESIGRSGRDPVSIGDVLDDLLRQRFGADSYERIDGDVPKKKKVAAMNNYNNKDLGRFVFLLEARACLPSIKLVSVDVVIIYGSDWNPVSDIRNLQKVELESPVEQIKLFRLYTSCTVEEKVLINAKNGESSTLQNAHPNGSHSLLMWGAKHLFDKLKEFHHSYGKSSCATSSDQSHTENVLQELLPILPEKDGNRSTTQSSNFFLISRAQHGSQAYYDRGIPLLGESKIQAEELPHLFWTKLLEGKAPDWKYSTVSQQRNRKRVQMNENIYAEQDDSIEVGKKRRKVAENNADLSSKKHGKDEHKLASADKEAVSGPVQLSSQEKGGTVVSDRNIVGSDGRSLRDAQSHLHLILKPQIAGLCEALSLESEVRNMVNTFLDYVINNRVVNQESATVLQAFQLALCWTAASLMKLKIDHKESLALAKERLNYACSKDDAEFLYTMLRGLKRPFLRQIDNPEAVHTSKAPQKVNEVPIEELNSNCLQPPIIFPNNVKVEIEDCPLNQESPDKDVVSSPTLGEEDISFSIQEIQGKCSEQMAELLREQEEERNEIYRSFEADKEKLEYHRKLDTFFITTVHRDGPMRAEKLKDMENEFARKIKERENEMSTRLKELKEAQLAARMEVQQKETFSVGVTLQDQIASVDPMCETGNQAENLQKNDREDIQQALPNKVEVVNEEAPAPITSVGTGNENEKLGSCKVLERGAVAGILEQDIGDTMSMNPSSEGDIPVGVTPALPGCEPSQGQSAEGSAAVQKGEVPSDIRESTNDISGQVVSVIPSSKDVVPPEEASTMPNRDVASDARIDVSSILETASGGVQPPSSERQVPDEAILETPGIVHDAVNTTSADGFNEVENAAEHHEDFPHGPIAEAPVAAIPDGEDTALGHNGLESASEHQEDGVSPMVVDNVTSISNQDTSGLEAAVPDVVDTAPGLNGLESTSEHQEDGVSPMVVDNVTSISNQGTSGQLMATPHSAAIPLNQNSMDQGTTSSMPDRLQEENASQQCNDMPPHVGSAQPSDRLDPKASGTEVAAQVPGLPLNLQTADGMLHQRSREDGPSTRNALDEFSPQPSMPTTLQLPTAPLGTLEIASLATQPSLPGATQMALSRYPDPLQPELQRLQKEQDKATMKYEEEKSTLRADCEREIAEIHRKYEMKVRQAEAEYLVKRNELILYQNKVLMNKILAEAFRSKCMDLHVSSAPAVAVQQDAMVGYAQQVLSPQNQQPSPSFVPRPSPSSLHQNNIRTATSQPINSWSHLPMSPGVSLQPMSHAQAASFRASRPPVIGQYRSTGNMQVHREVRSPAPAIQPFRPSFPALPHRAPAPQPGYQPNPMANLPPHLTQNGGPMGILNSRGSALELLRDIGIRPLANQQSNSFQMPSVNLTVQGNSPEVRAPSTGNNGTGDVVCLSDED